MDNDDDDDCDVNEPECERDVGDIGLKLEDNDEEAVIWLPQPLPLLLLPVYDPKPLLLNELAKELNPPNDDDE